MEDQMAGLPEQKIAIVRNLVQSAPDGVVGGLQAALMNAGADPALSSVRRLVEVEAADRRLRNAVFIAIAPLCVGDGRDPDRLRFPAQVLAAIWRGLKAICPREIEYAAFWLIDYRAGETSAEPFDDLVSRALAGMRAGGQPDFERALTLAEGARENGGRELCACLELSAVAREAIARLPEWIGRLSEERAAVARLAYKDAVSISEDSGPRFFEMLAGQLAEPWRVLRIISVVMDKPSEAYLAGSELAVFAERVFQAVDDGLAEVGRFDAGAGVAQARAAGKLVDIITHQIGLIDEAIELARETGWGKRLANERRNLAQTVERRLREAERAMMAALPRAPMRVARVMKDMPRLTEAPDGAAVNRAMSLLNFAEEIRSSANYGGFASMRTKVLESLGEAIDIYVEEVLDMMRHGEVEDPAIGHAYLNLAATFAGLVRDRRAAEVVRRRAAALTAAA
ncbi:hypothetical protein [Phenylobacterium sp.]|uniref:hypothetical protein n=1 Tax=Phenylobacterium sp. TaxID=1871053 RepID=UPI0035B2BA19